MPPEIFTHQGKRFLGWWWKAAGIYTRAPPIR